ncbi:MAG: S8 family serine peptidase [Chloroflexi bacterium]|nr:S8 family serine peptidase [Chloroflexota bacterium]
MRRVLLVLTLGLVSVVSASTQPLPPPATPLPDTKPQFGPGSRSAPGPIGPEDVIVTLRVADDIRSSGYRSSVRAAQDSVRTVLSPATAIKAQFENIPALSLRATNADLQVLAGHPLVASINPDTRLRTTDYEALSLIDGEMAWVSSEGYGVRVAVIDSGIDMAHPSAFLVDDVVGQFCFRTEGDCPPTGAQDETGHGTHVAGIITGKRGIANQAEIVAYKVFTTSDTTDTNVLNALDHIIANGSALGIKVVNMSLSGSLYSTAGACDTANPAYVSAFAQLNAQKIAVFASTGNDFASFAVGAPACVTGAIGVGSVSDIYGAWCPSDVRGLPSCFSNTTAVQGDGELVDLLAPGCAIKSEYLGGGYAVLCGTSMASPLAAGVAAVVLSGGHDATPAELEVMLEASGMPMYDNRTDQFYPMVNFWYAFGGSSLPAPENLQIDSESATHTTLSWTAPDWTGRLMERSVDNGYFGQILGSLRDGTFTDSNIPCGTLRYRVRTRGGMLTGSASNTVTRAAPAVPCPTPPSALDWTYAGGDQFNLTWTDTAADETGFVVERSSDQGLSFVQAVVINGSDQTTALDTTPDGCGDYVYIVRSLRADAYNSGSAPSGAVFAGCPPMSDPLGTPVPLNGWSGSVTESRVRYAKREVGDFAHPCRFGGAGAGNNTMYYTFTAPDDGYLTVDTQGSTYDTVLSVLTGSPGSFEAIACSEDFDPINYDLTSRVRYTPVQQGVTYTIYVSHWSSTAVVQPNTLHLAYDFRTSLIGNGSLEDTIVDGVPAGWQLIRPDPSLAKAKCKAKSGFAADGDCTAIFKPAGLTITLKQVAGLERWPLSIVNPAASDLVTLTLSVKGDAGTSKAVVKVKYADATPKTKFKLNLTSSLDYTHHTADTALASGDVAHVQVALKVKGLAGKLQVDDFRLWIDDAPTRSPSLPPPSAPEDFRRGGS